MTGNEYFGFPDNRQRQRQRAEDPGENAPIFIDRTAWSRAGGWGGQAFKTMPSGTHDAIAGKVWWRTPNNGGTPTLCFRWVIPDGPNRGAALIESLALKASSQHARSIAIGRLREIATAAGVADIPAQPSDLHGVAVRLVVGERPHWSKPGEVIPWVERHLPPAELPES